MEWIRPLLLTANDSGGAGTATRRIHDGLREIGIPSRILVRSTETDTPFVQGPQSKIARISSRVRPHIDGLPLRFYNPSSEFSLSWVPDRVGHQVDQIDPDVIHLNWVAGAFMSPKTIGEFDQSVVWRLPDMWPMTGGCHYAGDCERYTESCGSCPQLDSHRDRDPSRYMLSQKRRAVERADLTVVATTSWLAEQAHESTVFGDCPVEVIPNGLDTEIFSPRDGDIGRDLFGLPPDVPLVLFGAVGPLSNPRKGHDLLVEAIDTLSSDLDDSPELVIFGSSAPEDNNQFDLPSHYTGYIHDEESLALLYAAADVMVVPSRYEGFGQTVTEAMACGTPVVAFDATGPADTVRHRSTGYLAEPYQPDDLAKGIAWILADENRRIEIGEQARDRAVEHYHYEDVASEYLSLYQELV